MIDPQTITPTQLPSLPLKSRNKLPKTPGIYFAIDSQGTIQYIGRSVDINQRWKQHHRCDQLEEVGGVQIAWLEVSEQGLLLDIERALIKWFDPPLNNASIAYSSTTPLLMDVVRQVKISVPDLHERIREARENDGRSAQVLATLAGISTAYWYQLEAGKRKWVSEEVLRQIEDVLGIDFNVRFESCGDD